MECREFKNYLKQPNFSSPDVLENHLDNCPACASWLDNQLAQAPERISDLQMESPQRDLFKEVLPTQTSWIPNFLKPIFAAFSLATVLTCIWFFCLHQPITTTNSILFKYSFLEKKENLSAISFVEPSKKSVTFLGAFTSNEWSFLEEEKIYSFLENEKEGKS